MVSATWPRDISGSVKNPAWLHVGAYLNIDKYALLDKLRAIKPITYMKRFFFLVARTSMKPELISWENKMEIAQVVTQQGKWWG